MLLALLLLLCPVLAAQKVVAARAGMVYYAEGQFQIDGNSVRSANRLPQLEDSQVASSPRGHSEILLGPNAVLWTGTLAKVRFDNTTVESAEVTVLEGEAMIELTRSLTATPVRVRAGALEVDLTREGVYRFDASAAAMRIYAGEIPLSATLRAVRGQEVSGGGAKLFDRKNLDEFHYWCAYRSFMLESDAGKFRNWSSTSWTEREHSGFGVKFPQARGAARAKYLAASEAGLLYVLEGDAVTGTTARNNSGRLPLLLGQDNYLLTEIGKGEMFLGVGVVARIGENSQLRMVDSRPTRPVVALDRGTLMVEVAASVEGAPLRVQVGESITELLKPGLYEFNAVTASLLVFGGEAATTLAGSVMRTKESFTANLAQLAPPAKFNPKQLQGPLYRWAERRSFQLFRSSAAFMTPWESTQRPGLFKHKQFGNRRI